ncbi:MAG: anthranilate synthase component I family protein, partial [Synechococcaceae bacterium WB9_2_170]|nr:anthranilate synthase component I family protein [Synechococcaceae bacterium WB9_2_170]
MSSRLQRHALPWCDPALLVPALVERFGAEGLVWLDGDGTAQGRWSRIGVAPQSQIVCRGLPAMAGASDPFAALQAMGEQGGHWMGWLAYEAGAWVESADHWASSDLAMLWAARFESVLVLDHQHQTLVLEGSASGSTSDSQSAALAETLDALIRALASETTADRQINRFQSQPTIALGDWSWLTTSERFAEQVEQIRGWIASGDVFQANLTACCEASTSQSPDPLALYLRLRSHCPAPFGGVAIAGGSARGEAVLSSSPERFLKLN